MAWLWSTYEEFREWVQPQQVRQVHYRKSLRDSWFQHYQEICDAVRELQNAREELAKVNRSLESCPSDSQQLSLVHTAALEAVHAGETLLLYHRRLGISRWAYAFVSTKDLLNHWERYAATHRIPLEIDELIEGIDELLYGYLELHDQDSDFLIQNLALPEHLEAEFRHARNLFSVGFEEAGLLIVSRGLEGVLREIARKRQITMLQRGTERPAWESDFHDLIEVFARVRWKATGERLLTNDEKALLHYLRTVRNNAAHPKSAKTVGSAESVREVAQIATTLASGIWRRLVKPRPRLASTRVERSWSN